MGFKIAARTILHLGAELISSDGIAFYELIKNAFDAGSRRVNIDVVVRIPYDNYSELMETAKQASRHDLGALRKRIIDHIDFSAPESQKLEDEITHCRSVLDIVESLEDANYIEIRDKGEGMSLKDLEEVYLTIGTRSRYIKKKRQIEGISDTEEDIEDTIAPILGDKGVGRLSAMRLGQKLKVITAKKADDEFNILKIDWGKFSHESDSMLDEIIIEPERGQEKDDPNYSGTTLIISRLESEWTTAQLEDIVKEEFNKLIDPFDLGNESKQHRIVKYKGNRFDLNNESNPRIIVKFNGNKIEIPRFNRMLFDNAHAMVQAELTFIEENGSKVPVINGIIDYRLRNKKKPLQIKTADIISAAFPIKGKDENVRDRIPRNPEALLESLGPFKTVFYWYNRPLLHTIDAIGDRQQVIKLVNQWAGGLKVYRDGFRVNPYGNRDDDWLDLDRKAFASGGYKVNKQQIVGKVEISSFKNPKLVDQTNREGLRRCIERDIFVGLLRHILTTEFKGFIQKVDDEIRAVEPITLEDLEEQLDDQRKIIDKSFRYLLQEHPEIEKASGHVIREIKEAIGDIKHSIVKANDIASSYEKSRGMILHLAGLGQMVSIITHELNRATEHALNELKHKNISSAAQLDTLEAQLRTIHKRLRVLDPLDTTARQTKSNVELITWTQKNIDYHQGQFRRHGIVVHLKVIPSKSSQKLTLRLVQGMLVQILENLISNSVYWLKLQKIIDHKFEPRIDILIDTQTKQLIFSDNGPGIEWSRREEVFEPFVTTKPPGEGKGLGLYIAREIAKYHGISLSLLFEDNNEQSKSSTFIINFAGLEQ